MPPQDTLYLPSFPLEQSQGSVGHSQVWDFVLLRGDTRLVSGSSDAELRVWALNFKDTEKEVEVNKEKKEEDADGPPSKMFRLDTEGEVKAKEEDEEIKDDAVSVFKRPKALDLFTVSLDSLVKKW